MAGPMNQTGTFLATDDNVVPPTSYYVACSIYLSKNGLYTLPTTTAPIPTYTTPSGIVDCAVLISANKTTTGSTILQTFIGTSFEQVTQACTAWAASSLSSAHSPQGTADAMLQACRAQVDFDTNPSFANVTGSVIAQVYAGSLLPSDYYSQYRNSTSFPVPYSTANPSGGRVTTMPCASFE